MKTEVPTYIAAKDARKSIATRTWQWVEPLVRYLRAMVVFLIIWHLLSLQIDNKVLLPSPLAVGSHLIDLVVSGKMFRHAASSIWRGVVAYLVACFVGVPIGFLMGLSSVAEDLIDPIIELVRPISGIAWIPLALYIFGIGNILPIFIILYVAFFPFVLNTVGGVRATDPLLVRAAQTMGVGRHVIILRVILPSTLPWVLTGARLAATGAWMALIAAEFIGAPSGLGFAVSWYGGLLRTSDMLAMIATIALLGYCTDIGLRRLQAHLTPWARQRGAQ